MEDQDTGADTTSTSEENAADTQSNNQSDKTTDQDFDFGKERERMQGGSKYTPREKALHSARSIKAELEKHGIDPTEVFGGSPSKKDNTDDEEPAKDKPLTRDEMEKVIEERLSKERRALRDPLLESKIAPLARSKDEGAVIKEWANIVEGHVGNIDEAVNVGWMIANRHRLKDTIAEIIRGKKNEGTAGSEGTGAGERKNTGGKQAPTGKEAEFAKSRGLVWDGTAGKWVSPAGKKHREQNRR